LADRMLNGLAEIVAQLTDAANDGDHC
jgi:hypothetical protein